MSYTPYGVTGDAIKKAEYLKELKKIEQYLLEHPNEKEHSGYTLERVRKSIETSENFKFLP